MEVDGVFSGGGIRGIAFIGAIQVLEERGFQFRRLAGTSAGSLVAALLAAGYRSEELYQEISQISMNELLDRRKFQIPFPILRWFPLYWRMGLYKGDKLEDWIGKLLKKKGVRTFADISPGSLKIVASDLSNGKILVIPDDLHRYDLSPEAFSVARAVRMSCTVPYFFEPVKMRYRKQRAVIVDGGVLSNFPMWLFAGRGGKQKRPVIGINLSPKQDEYPANEITNALELFEALFKTMKDAHDNRYISRRHAQHIIFLPTEGIGSLDFSNDEEQIAQLIAIGREETEKFLKSWYF